jgi:hypothetical protein
MNPLSKADLPAMLSSLAGQASTLPVQLQTRELGHQLEAREASRLCRLFAASASQPAAGAAGWRRRAHPMKPCQVHP